MLRDPNIELDGSGSFVGGKHGGILPSLLAADQFQSAVNVSIRGGSVGTRPPFEQVPLSFQDNYDTRHFKEQLFQGAFFSDETLYAAVGGSVFRILPERSGLVENLSQANPQVCAFSGITPSVYFEQAGQYVVAQDGIHNALIIGDNIVRQANPQGETLYDPGLGIEYTGNHELPPGTVMAAGQGRLFVAYPNSNAFYATDPEFPFHPEQILRVSEQRDQFRGGPLIIPRAFGPIVAMKFMQRLDTTTGDGPLLVFGTRGVVAFIFPADRGVWSSTTIGRYALLNDGAVGHRALTQVNSDMFFRASTGGIRSFNLSYQEFQAQYANTPISREVQDRMDEDTNWLMRDADVVTHNNRVLFTTSPSRDFVARPDLKSYLRETRFRGILSMNLDALSSMRGKAAPAYEDIWTGLNVVGMVSGIVDRTPRLFIFTRDHSNHLALYTLNESGNRDNGRQPISSKVAFRSFRFTSNFSLHELTSLELWVSNMFDPDIEIRAYYRPDTSPDWIEWGDCARRFSIQTCSLSKNPTTGCLDFVKPGRGAVRRLTFNSPPDDECDPLDSTTKKRAAEFQVKVEWVGRMQIDRVRVVARGIEEKVAGQCLGTDEEPETILLDKECETDYGYTVVGE